MPQFDVDLFVIGAGSGGVRAARIASGHGARVAVAEEFRTGGTCVIRGCVPKKILALASRFRDAFEDAAGFGWTMPKAPEFSWDVLRAAKDREIGRLSGLYERNLENAGVTLHHDRAVLVDRNTVRLVNAGTTITAKYILVATGGHAVRPQVSGCELGVVSDDAFDFERLPGRIAIVGGGYIAVEFACLLQRLGSAVTVVHRGEKILRGFDEDLADELMLAMAAEGITLKMNDTITGIEKQEDCLHVAFSGHDTGEFDAVFFATGRRPNTEGLGLEEAGVKLGEDGSVTVDADCRSSVDNIFAVGDVTGGIALTPVAIKQGHALADTLFGKKSWAVDHSIIATAVFSTPEIGTVGLTEGEARERLKPVDIYRARFRSLKHTLTRRQERTLMKLIVDPETDRILGAHVMGEDAAEMIQLIAVSMGMGATKADFDRTMPVHPSAAEEWVTMREKVQITNPGGA